MISLILLMALLIFVFYNILFLIAALVSLSILSLYSIYLGGLIASLTSMIIVIVYVGAMLIIIVYVCCVNPNIILEPNYNLLFPLFVTLPLIHELIPQPFPFITPPKISYGLLVDYFFADYGDWVLAFVVIMLFIVLLIITAQFISSGGPFRSGRGRR